MNKDEQDNNKGIGGEEQKSKNNREPDGLTTIN